MKMLLPVLAVLSSTAMAADMKWNLEGRFDYGMSTVKHEQVTATNNAEEKRAEFYSNVLRLNSVFTINESLSGRLRYRFSTGQEATKQNRDLSFQNLDFLYVDHKNQWFTARLGKHSQTESLGREFFMSGTDYPTTGVVNSSTSLTQTSAGNAAAGAATGYAALNSLVYNLVKNDADLYRVGASAIYTGLQGSTFTVSAFNPQKSTTYSDAFAANDNSTNKKLGWGAYYSGTFAEKMFQPTLGYSQFGIAGEKSAATPANESADATQKLIAAGVRSEVAGFVVDVDWKQYKRDNTTKTALAINNADKSTSIWANVAYTWENLTPFVNYINDKYDQSSSDVNDFKRNAFTAGLQIKPFKENNFRYHVAYTSDVKKIDAATAGDKKVTSNMWVAGIKFDL